MPGKALRGYHKLEQAEAAAACSANVDRPARARTSSHHHVTSLGVVDEDESDSDATDDKSCDDVINFDMDIVYLRAETRNDGHHQHDVKLPPASHDSGVHVGI